MMFEGAGYEMTDMETDVNAEDFVAAVREHHPQVSGLNALLTTTMVNMRSTIEALDEAGVRDLVKTAIGGAPVTSGFLLSNMPGTQGRAGPPGPAPGGDKVVTQITATSG